MSTFLHLTCVTFLHLTCDLCVQVLINNTVLKNAADAAIKNFDAMLSYEIAKDPTAGKFVPVLC